MVTVGAGVEVGVTVEDNSLVADTLGATVIVTTAVAVTVIVAVGV